MSSSREGPLRSNGGEVDDHGDVLVAAAGVAPHVFVDANDLHAVQALGVIDEESSALGEDGCVGGLPRHPKRLSDPSDREMLNDDALQRPAQAAPGDLPRGSAARLVSWRHTCPHSLQR
jgi:hypothetical protein